MIGPSRAPAWEGGGSKGTPDPTTTSYNTRLGISGRIRRDQEVDGKPRSGRLMLDLTIWCFGRGYLLDVYVQAVSFIRLQLN